MLPHIFFFSSTCLQGSSARENSPTWDNFILAPRRLNMLNNELLPAAQDSIHRFYCRQIENEYYLEDEDFMRTVESIWKTRPLWPDARGVFYGKIYNVELDATVTHALGQRKSYCLLRMKTLLSFLDPLNEFVKAEDFLPVSFRILSNTRNS